VTPKFDGVCSWSIIRLFVVLEGQKEVIDQSAGKNLNSRA